MNKITSDSDSTRNTKKVRPLQLAIAKALLAVARAEDMRLGHVCSYLDTNIP
jgi:hypothetical protein